MVEKEGYVWGKDKDWDGKKKIYVDVKSLGRRVGIRDKVDIESVRIKR